MFGFEKGCFKKECLADNHTIFENKKIELEFSAAVGDNFSIKVALGDVSVTENFML